MEDFKRHEIANKFKRKVKGGLYRMSRPLYTWSKGKEAAVVLNEDDNHRVYRTAGPFAKAITPEGPGGCCTCASPHGSGE